MSIERDADSFRWIEATSSGECQCLPLKVHKIAFLTYHPGAHPPTLADRS